MFAGFTHNKVVIDMDKQAFSERLSALRINKGVSAWDMSLSIGQSPGYINVKLIALYPDSLLKKINLKII